MEVANENLCWVQDKTLGGLAVPQTPSLFNFFKGLTAKAKPWALPKPARAMIALDPQ
jgi:hypothetical protein